MFTITRQNAASVVMLAATAFLFWFGAGCGGDDASQPEAPNVDATVAAALTEVLATREAADQAATPTLAPTDTPRPNPTPTQVPTPTVAPPPTEVPTPAPATSPATDSDALTALPVTDPDSFLASVSEAERTCLQEKIPPNQLPMLTTSPQSGTDEERAAMLGCLEEDTTLRLFLTHILQATGPLSPESSVCIRSSFMGTDLEAVMMAGSNEAASDTDTEATQAKALVSIVVALSCLNESEFAAAGPAMGISSEQQDAFQCVMEAVGGPEAMAALMHPEAGFPLLLFQAAADCQLEPPGPPPGN